jgi:hypothetical protein
MKNIKLVLFVALSTLSFVLNAQKVLQYSKAGTVTIDCYQGGFLPTAECKTCALSGDKEYHNGLIIKRGSTVVARVNGRYNWKIASDQIVFYWWTQNSSELNSYTVRVSETGYLKINDIVAAVQGCQASGSSGGGAVTSVNGQTGAVTIAIPPTANLGYNNSTHIITNSGGTSATLPLATSVVDGLMPLADKQKSDLITVTSAVNLNNLLLGNTAITGATKTKITYDSKGLVTAGADATAADILNVASGTIAATNVQAAINELNAEKLNIADTALYNSKALTTAQLAYKLNATDTALYNSKALTLAQLAYKQDKVTYQNATVQSAAAGVATTINFTGGITSTLAGSTLTVNVPAVANLAYYVDDAEAAAAGIALNGEYLVNTGNPYGLSKGVRKARQ